MLCWTPCISWTLICRAVSAHLQTNCWSDWAQIWWTNSFQASPAWLTFFTAFPWIKTLIDTPVPKLSSRWNSENLTWELRYIHHSIACPVHKRNLNLFIAVPNGVRPYSGDYKVSLCFSLTFNMFNIFVHLVDNVLTHFCWSEKNTVALWVLTHLPLDKMAAISQTTFQMHFREWKVLYLN